MGRVKIIDKGPRNIDLDILLHDQVTEWSDERLQIPHPLMFEREFVLRPLYQYAISPSIEARKSNISQSHVYRNRRNAAC
jgi:2-amino-4-hydroxy-6-hydroxymethyldihydropteridine diphosphokinase/dihydropteroate synthase